MKAEIHQKSGGLLQEEVELYSESHVNLNRVLMEVAKVENRREEGKVQAGI